MLQPQIGAPRKRVEPALPLGLRGGRMTSDGPRRDDTDELLLAQVASADPQAFETLYRAYGRVVYSLALAMLRDPHAAQEVAQEVFLGIWHGADDFDPRRGSARAWILSLAHHKSVDAVRRLRVRARVPRDSTHADGPDIIGEVMRRVEGEKVRQTLLALSYDQREVLVLAYYGGHTQQEIAQRLGIPLGTVKTRMRDGMIRLRALLGTRVSQVDP